MKESIFVASLSLNVYLGRNTWKQEKKTKKKKEKVDEKQKKEHRIYKKTSMVSG